MPSVSSVVYYLFHPDELKAIIQWKVWHDPVHSRPNTAEIPATEAKCLDFLRLTSRSFYAVIMELHPELLLPVCLFYLVLRGLDTIEDDTSIPYDQKEPLLRDFHKILAQDRWNFTGNRPEEKDRELLVQFHNVIVEVKKLKQPYQEIIADITSRMGNGMADYCKRADLGDLKIETVADFDNYCYYVAGLVGEGLTRLFVEAGFATPVLLQRPHLFISMGLCLQKTNIIRDVREDQDDNRRFWPRAIWSKYVDKWEDLFDARNAKIAMDCSSDMVLDALRHAEDCITYLQGLSERSVFNFAAIPQTMAVATLQLCFRNPDLFQTKVKITKGETCHLMWQSTQTLPVLVHSYRALLHRIHKKNSPDDPNFIRVSSCCGQLESFFERYFPAKPRGVESGAEGRDSKTTRDANPAAANAENDGDMFYILLGTIIAIVLVTSTMFLTAWMAGARFDLAFRDIKESLYELLAPSSSSSSSSSSSPIPTVEVDSNIRDAIETASVVSPVHAEL